MHNILIVDDHRDAAESLASFLTLLGHDVRVAYGGAQALEAVADRLPTVAILDIDMPEMNGYELAQGMRTRLGARCPLLVALTALARPEDKARALAAGFDHHLQKPLDPELFSTAIASGPCAGQGL